MSDSANVQARVVIVDGVPMSGLLAEAPEPAGVVVALHGGATTAAYFDCPGHPDLSLLRTAPQLGFTALALDRPGFGSSALYESEFASTPRRVEMTYRAVDAMLGTRERGAGIFVLAHSAGGELALQLAAHERGADLLGLEIAGTGLRYQPAAVQALVGVTRPGITAGLRELLWEPADLYPDGVANSVRVKSGPISPGYEAAVVTNWRRDFPELAARVRVPVRYTLGEFERVWSTEPDRVAAVAALFTAAPRVVTHRQDGGGHNLSLGHIAPTYHRSALQFARECTLAATDSTTEAT